MNRKFYFPATVALCGAWIWALVSERVADDLRVGIWMLVALAVVSFLALRYVQRERPVIGLASMVLCVVTLAFLMCTAWGLIVSSISAPVLPEWLPKALRLSPLFLVGPLAALAVGLLFAYPLAVLLPGMHWLVPLLAVASVSWIQYGDFTAEKTPPLTLGLMVFELICLAIIVPVIARSLRERMHISPGALARGG